MARPIYIHLLFSFTKFFRYPLASAKTGLSVHEVAPLQVIWVSLVSRLAHLKKWHIQTQFQRLILIY